MNAAEYVVPAVLRGARFVPGQAAGRREPARVTAGAFRAAGLPVPAHPAQRNVYQLTGRRGLPWTPGLDAHIHRRAANCSRRGADPGGHRHPGGGGRNPGGQRGALAGGPSGRGRGDA